MEINLDQNLYSAKKSGKKGKQKNPSSENERKLKDTIQQLKAENNKLKKENRELRSDTKTTKKTFDENIKQIEKLTEEKSLDEVFDLTDGEDRRDRVRKRVAEQYSTLGGDDEEQLEY